MRRYNMTLLNSRRDTDESDVALLSAEEILQRAQRVAFAASTSDSTNQQPRYGSSSEYRCLETGGFLVPSVSQHPWYQDVEMRATKLLVPAISSRVVAAVLDVGCGMGADGRQMLLDGFATTVVGVDRSSLYLRLGCELFGDNPEEIVLPTSATAIRKLPQGVSRVVFLTANIAEQVDTSCSSKDVASVVDQIQTVLLEQVKNQTMACDRAQSSHYLTEDSANMVQTTHQDSPQFTAVYAGKFFHCLETEDNFRIALGNIRALLVTGGCLFGVFGRNYEPAFECASRDDFFRVVSSEGYEVALLQEEAAGATWFCVHKRGEE